MPELLEVETYRTQAEAVVGRRIAALPVLDPLGLRGADPDAVRAEVVGATVTSAERTGKLLLLRTTVASGPGPTVGLRFGMTGRLLVDGAAAITELEYGASGDDPAWDRIVVAFAGGGTLVVRDPRRLGGLEVDPDETRLGPDAASITAPQLRRALRSASGTPSRTALKARLLDQSRVAGLGNLLVDESLWRAGIDPARPCDRLADDEVALLARTVRSTVAELGRRGGSHTGDLQPGRVPGGACPADGAPLERLTVGGRTTYRCPSHQR